MISHCLEQSLARGGAKFSKGTEDVVLDYKDINTGRSKHVGVRDLFQGGGTDGSSLWVRDFFDDPPDVPGHGGVP